MQFITAVYCSHFPLLIIFWKTSGPITVPFCRTKLNKWRIMTDQWEEKESVSVRHSTDSTMMKENNTAASAQVTFYTVNISSSDRRAWQIITHLRNYYWIHFQVISLRTDSNDQAYNMTEHNVSAKTGCLIWSGVYKIHHYCCWFPWWWLQVGWMLTNCFDSKKKNNF